MKDVIDPTPDQWLSQAFSTPTAQGGGVIKRSLADVDRITGREHFLSEVRRRGFQAIINGDALIVFCNREPVRLATARAPLVLK